MVVLNERGAWRQSTTDGRRTESFGLSVAAPYQGGES